MELMTGISILGAVVSVIAFALGRKDKSNKDTKDESYHLGQIDTKLKNIENVLSKIERKLDDYEDEINSKIEKAIQKHEQTYHKGE